MRRFFISIIITILSLIFVAHNYLRLFATQDKRQLNRAAANLTIFDILLIPSATINFDLNRFATIRTLYWHLLQTLHKNLLLSTQIDMHVIRKRMAFTSLQHTFKTKQEYRPFGTAVGEKI